jgi:3-hydroxyanthranilate 3,4-dioxygenase
MMPFQTLGLPLPQVDLQEVMHYLTHNTHRRTYPIFQHEDCLCFVARGRAYRSEFHLNPSYELQYSLKGLLNLHWRDPAGARQISVVPEGHCLYQAPYVPHSPRFDEQSFQLVVERMRRPGEIDRFHWYCEACDHLLHEEVFTLANYDNDPVSRAYENFWGNDTFRTCRHCGTYHQDVSTSQE